MSTAAMARHDKKEYNCFLLNFVLSEFSPALQAVSPFGWGKNIGKTAVKQKENQQSLAVQGFAGSVMLFPFGKFKYMGVYLG